MFAARILYFEDFFRLVVWGEYSVFCVRRAHAEFLFFHGWQRILRSYGCRCLWHCIFSGHWGLPKARIKTKVLVIFSRDPVVRKGNGGIICREEKLQVFKPQHGDVARWICKKWKIQQAPLLCHHFWPFCSLWCLNLTVAAW